MVPQPQPECCFRWPPLVDPHVFPLVKKVPGTAPKAISHLPLSPATLKLMLRPFCSSKLKWQWQQIEKVMWSLQPNCPLFSAAFVGAEREGAAPSRPLWWKHSCSRPVSQLNSHATFCHCFWVFSSYGPMFQQSADLAPCTEANAPFSESMHSFINLTLTASLLKPPEVFGKPVVEYSWKGQNWRAHMECYKKES